MSYPPQYPPQDNSGTLKSISWGVWILVFVFVILPVLVVLCCCAGPPIMAGIGAALDDLTR